MIKLTIGVATAALCLGMQTAHAQVDPSDHEPKSQAQIMKERNRACEGLKDREFRDCMNDYVGPKASNQIDGDTSAEAGAKQRESAKDEAQPADVDMTENQKRAPVGPVKSGPQSPKQ